MLPNHHITKPVFIGEIEPTASSTWCGRRTGLVPGDAWSKELEGSKDLVADWVQAQVRQLQHQDQQVRQLAPRRPYG